MFSLCYTFTVLLWFCDEFCAVSCATIVQLRVSYFYFNRVSGYLYMCHFSSPVFMYVPLLSSHVFMYVSLLSLPVYMYKSLLSSPVFMYVSLLSLPVYMYVSYS